MLARGYAIMGALHQMSLTVVKSFTAELTRVRKLSESTRDFRFIAEEPDVEFLPGQFYRFVLEDDRGEFERSYSLCNFLEDATGPVMDLVVSTVAGGRASQVLFSAEPGLKVSVSGPFGRLVLPGDMPQRLFLVATSVGIAPFMPMLGELAKLGDSMPEVYFLYGARDHSEFVYGDALMAFAVKHQKFHLCLCLSRCEVDQSIPLEQIRGYVQDKLFALDLDPATDHLLLCGNPRMIDDCYPRLKDLGFGVKQVIREKYVFAKDSSDNAKKTSDKKTGMTEAQKKLLAEKMAKYQS